jgi:Spy/CpxP family protein refolding chaperone
MKRWGLLALVVILATGVSFALSHWLAARQPVTAGMIHNPAWLARELKLSDTQAREVEKLETGFRDRLAAACVRHCDARMALGDELATAQPDVAKCREWVEKMNAVQAECEQMTLDHILKVRALLDSRQAQQYSALIRDQVCNMPMGAP